MTQARWISSEALKRPSYRSCKLIPKCQSFTLGAIRCLWVQTRQSTVLLFFICCTYNQDMAKPKIENILCAVNSLTVHFKNVIEKISSAEIRTQDGCVWNSNLSSVSCPRYILITNSCLGVPKQAATLSFRNLSIAGLELSLFLIRPHYVPSKNPLKSERF